jgi:hypothetical protein
VNSAKKLALFVGLLSLCHCESTPEKKKILLPKSQSSYSTQTQTRSLYNDIDVNALLVELGMDHPMEQVGFTERPFNTCQVKANRSPRPQCQRLYVTRLNFKLMCRHSTGTVERVNLTPLFTRKLRWKGGRMRGYTSTNSKGFGSLGFITPTSSRYGHLYLYLGSKIARKKFQDQWKLVLPESWCLDQ